MSHRMKWRFGRLTTTDDGHRAEGRSSAQIGRRSAPLRASVSPDARPRRRGVLAAIALGLVLVAGAACTAARTSDGGGSSGAAVRKPPTTGRTDPASSRSSSWVP